MLFFNDIPIKEEGRWWLPSSLFKARVIYSEDL